MRESFAVKIKKFRKQKGMSQAEFAKKIGVWQTQVSRYERGEITPTVTTLEWICDAFGLSATELLGF